MRKENRPPRGGARAHLRRGGRRAGAPSKKEGWRGLGLGRFVGGREDAVLGRTSARRRRRRRPVRILTWRAVQVERASTRRLGSGRARTRGAGPSHASSDGRLTVG